MIRKLRCNSQMWIGHFLLNISIPKKFNRYYMLESTNCDILNWKFRFELKQLLIASSVLVMFTELDGVERFAWCIRNIVCCEWLAMNWLMLHQISCPCIYFNAIDAHFVESPQWFLMHYRNLLTILSMSNVFCEA